MQTGGMMGWITIVRRLSGQHSLWLDKLSSSDSHVAGMLTIFVGSTVLVHAR